ncbi:thioredoxin [Halorubellus sp. JP-L1]|uniref:thioredoxin n=1 Tax=Halorubellus sp. JP-L1 TaxID=2715753 RepID=UPI00140D4F0C|nr:thioredoxin [Halorubellus sp. JP-L1]NHN42878.1 thioredoxin [Halorubellus sp. JP-L1]
MTEEIEEIRRQKLEELRSRDERGSANASEPRSPTEPVPVDGDAELSETVAEHDVVLVDFYADWCGPCQMLEPVVETVAAETDAAVAKVDIDANQSLAAEYSVRGVPTLLLFADGQPVERLVGMQEEARLRSLIERHG